MDVSLSQTTNLTCPQCGQPFTAEIWLIVDGNARPELLDRVRAGTLHAVACPQCGPLGQVDAPLLLYLLDRDPPLLFSPAQQTTQEQDRQQAVGLINALRERLVPAWQDAWGAQGIPGVQRAMLPAALSADPEAALRELQAQAVREMERLRAEDPEQFAQLEAAAQQMLANAPLLQTLQSFIQAETWDESRRIVQAHPELLTDEVSMLLDQLLEVQESEGARQAIAQYHALLRRCREAGIDAAFAETTNSTTLVDIPVELQQLLAELSRPMGIMEMPRRVALCQQALAQLPRDAHPQLWAALQVELGNSLAQNPHGARAENLELAIAHYQQALEVRTRQAMPVEWAATMMNLGVAYADRIQGARAENLEQAIQCFEQALEVMTRQAMPVEWATAMNNLGNAYSDRIRGARAENLELAIHCFRQTLEVMTRQAMPIAWAQAINSLANAYRQRIRGVHVENLELAIQHYQQALEVRTRQTMPVEWAHTMNDLASAFAQRAWGTRAENLEQALQHYQRALEVLTQQSMPVEWAKTTMNLASVYLQRTRGAQTENQELAIQHYQEALGVLTHKAMPLEWATTMMNLANAYLQRVRGARTENLKLAIQHYQQALKVFELPILPDNYRRVQRNLCLIHFERQCWSETQATALAALEASQQLYRVTATPEARWAELRESRNLPALAAYATLRETPEPTALAQAVVLLEQNRARWLSEALAQGAEKPAAAPEALWQAFTAQRVVIQELEAELRLPEDTPGRRDYVTLSQLMTAARQQLTEQIARIREHAPEFIPQPSFAEISAAAARTPLVYLVTTPAGGLALLVQGETVTPVWLDALTEEALQTHAREHTNAYFAWRNASRDAAARRAWFDALETTLTWLRETIIIPLLAGLADSTAKIKNPKFKIVLIPTDTLALLPLHAAATDLVWTYTPNARALNAAQQVAQACAPTSLLAIDNPDGSLLFSGTEVAAALEIFPADQRLHLPNAAATPQAVRAALGDYAVWHFSTHGWAGWQQPLESGLLLANKAALTLRELLGLQAQARLAVLSACETGIPGTELPDEVISLPAGLLQAGVAGVVGSLWAVNDFSTALLMMRFYQAWRMEKQEPPEALHTAQTWLRTSTNADFAAYFKERLPEFGGKGLPEEVASDGYRRFLLEADPAAQPFAHPFYWAGFYYTGV